MLERSPGRLDVGVSGNGRRATICTFSSKTTNSPGADSSTDYLLQLASLRKKKRTLDVTWVSIGCVVPVQLPSHSLTNRRSSKLSEQTNQKEDS